METRIDNEISKLDKNLKLIALSSGIVFIGVVLSKILTYIYRIIVANQFGPKEYGLFSLATMIATLIVVIASLGLPEGIIRYISLYRGKKDWEKISAIINKSNLALFIISIIGCIALAIFAKDISLKLFHAPELIPYLYIAAISIPFFILANFYLSILRAYEKITCYSIGLNFVQNFFKVAIIAVLIIAGIKHNAAMLSYFAGIFAMFLFAYIFVKKYIKISRNTLPKKEQNALFGKVLKYSWPLSLLGVASFALYWTDSFTIGYFMSPEHVGFYNIAIPLATLIMIAPDLIIQLFFPLIMKEYSQNRNDLIEQLSKQVMKWIFVFNLPIVVVLIFFPGAAINLLFDKQYLIAENALRLLAIGSLFSSLTVVPNHLISMTGRSKTILYNIIAMLVINLILNIILVPIYGIDGAAFATMIMLIALCGITFRQTKRFLSFLPLRRKMLPVFLACAIPLFPLSLLKYYIPLNIINIAWIGAVFIISYATLVILLGGLDKHDLAVIYSLKSKIGLKK